MRASECSIVRKTGQTIVSCANSPIQRNTIVWTIKGVHAASWEVMADNDQVDPILNNGVVTGVDFMNGAHRYLGDALKKAIWQTQFYSYYKCGYNMHWRNGKAITFAVVGKDNCKVNIFVRRGGRITTQLWGVSITEFTKDSTFRRSIIDQLQKAMGFKSIIMSGLGNNQKDKTRVLAEEKKVDIIFTYTMPD